MSHIFISYSRKDLAIAEKIIDALAKDDLEPWIDWKSIPKGETFEIEIRHGIEKTEIFLFLVSPDSVKSDWCNLEIAHAIKNNKRILPIVIRDTDPKSIHLEISKRNWIFCRDGQDDFNRAIEETRETIHTNYEWLKYHTELQVKALRWGQINDNSLLLRGKELSEAEQKITKISTQEDPQPTLLQREYILSSQQNEMGQRRNIVFSLVIGIIIMTALAITAWAQRNSAITSEQNAIAEANAKFTALANEAYALSTAQAEANARATAQVIAYEQENVAIAEKLNVQSLTEQENNFSTSLLLGIEAYKKNAFPQTKGLLLSNFFAASRLQTYLNGHTSRVNDVVYSPDGKIIASASDDNLIILWDTHTFSPIGKPLSGHTNQVTSLAFSPDGRFLVSASLDNNIIFWNIETQQPIGEPLRGHKYRTTHILFTADGKYLISIGCSEIEGHCQKEQITVWDVESRKPIQQSLQLTSGVINCVDFNPDSTILAICDDNSDILLIDMHSFKVVNKLSTNYSTGRLFAISSIDFSPDGTKIAVGYDSSIILFSVPDLQPVDLYLNGHTSSVRSVAFSPDGETLISGGFDQQVIIWNLDEKEPVEKMAGHTREVTKISFSPDGSSFVSGGGDGKVIVWSSQTIETFEKIKVNYPIYDITISPHGDLLAFAGDSNIVSLQDIKSLESVGQVQIPGAINITSLEFSHDGHLLAAGSCAKEQVEGYCVRGDIILIDVASQSIINAPLVKHNREIKSLAFSPNDNLIISGGSDNKLILWDINTSEFVRDLLGHSNWVSSLDFSPNGRLIASGSYDNTIFFWETDNFSLINQNAMGHDAWVTSLKFSPDGKKLASGGWDGTINLWDINTQKLIGNPMKEFEWTEILSIAFSPDGLILASGKTDKTVTLWDVEKQQIIGEPLKAHTYFVNSVVFSSDGRYLVTGGEDGRIVVWDIEPESIIEKTCIRVGRNFTQAEWQQYFSNEPYRLTCPQYPVEE